MAILIKLLFAALLVMVLVNLFRGLLAMLRGPEGSGKPMSAFLGRRLLFSVAILLLLLLLLAMGLLHPNHRPY